ncbi:hypothetical protein IPA_07120 [Ignicoccus pacificus DSM 13166]|uniref:Polymerase nucleotidyl transferase domain-containing protein n=1 Tax=Ignicoccus pacificus DSM 13166 TaxID=940294 RepID=A0A977KBJ0_9CREN|nr:hypothetical protein IPA_07120 [Ignicoccus pacificus DSM 13166]
MFEDKRVLLMRNGEVRVVVGYEHPPGCSIAYLKYVYTGRGPWKGFERVVKEYTPEEVRKGSLVYDPNFGSLVPCASHSEVLRAPDPLERAKEVISSPKDLLEERFVELYDCLRIRDLGLGGSLLLGIQHENSDVDSLIYPRGDPLWIWEELENSDLLEEEREWSLRVSKLLGLPLNEVKRLYSKAKRAMFKGTAVSFAFVKKDLERYGSSVADPIGKIELVLDMEPCPEALYYPHRCWAGRYLIESYESSFVKVFVKGGRVRVKGYLWRRSDGTEVIRIGGREERGYLLFA